MSQEKEKELAETISRFTNLITTRVRTGDAKYKGTPKDFDNLSPLELLYESLEEKVDDINYTMKAIMKLEALLKPEQDSPAVPGSRD